MHDELAYVERLIRTDPEAALIALDRLKAEEGSRARAFWLRGQAQHALRRPTTALEWLEAARTLVAEQGDTRFLAQIEFTISGVHFDERAYDRALLHARRALEAATQGPGDPHMRGRILVGLGHIQYIRGDLDSALDHYQRALDIFAPVRDLENLGPLYSGLSGVYERKADYAASLRYARLRVSAHEALQKPRAVADGMAILALAYRNVGELDNARETATETLRLARELNLPDIEARAYAALATIALGAGNHDEAAREAERVLELLPDEADPTRCDAAAILAEIAEERGDHQTADRLYRASIDALFPSGNLGRYEEACIAYSHLLEWRGDIAGALEFARRASEARTA